MGIQYNRNGWIAKSYSEKYQIPNNKKKRVKRNKREGNNNMNSANIFNSFMEKFLNEDISINDIKNDFSIDEKIALSKCCFNWFFLIGITAMISLGIYLHTFLVIVPIILTFFGIEYSTGLMCFYMKWKKRNNL